MKFPHILTLRFVNILMRQPLVHIVSALVLYLMFPAGATAQTGTGQLSITVVPSDSIQPTITVSAQRGIGIIRQAKANEQGTALFFGLEQGSHKISIDHPKYQPVVAEVSIEPGENLLLQAILIPRSTIDETSRLSVTARHSFRLHTHFSSDQLRMFPASGSMWSLIETAAPLTFVDQLDTGGVRTGHPPVIGSRGSSWTQTSFQINGLDITDQTQGGVPLSYPDTTAFGAMTVLSGLMPIEQDAPGTVVTLFPKRPQATFHGSAQASISPNFLQSKDSMWDETWTQFRGNLIQVQPIARLNSWHDGSVGIGGSLGVSRSAGFLSGRTTQAKTTGRYTHIPLLSSVASIFGHATLLPTTHDEIRLTVAGQQVQRPFAGRTRLVNRGTTETDRFIQLQSSWGRVQKNGMTWSIASGMQHGQFQPDLTDMQAGTVERLRDGYIPAIAFQTKGSRWRWTSRAHVQSMLPTIGRISHSARFGINLTKNGVSQTGLDIGPTAEKINGIPARLWDYGYPGANAEWSQTALGLYAAHHIEISDRLLIEAGVRFDTTDGSALGSSQNIRWRNASASLSSRLNFQDGRTSIITGYRKYQYRLALQHLAFGDVNGPQGTVYRWKDSNGDGAYQANEQGSLIAYVGPGGSAERSTIDTQLKQPYTDELIIGFETRWPGSWLVRFIGTARRDRQLLVSMNVGVPNSQYTVSFIPDTGVDLLAPPDNQYVPVYNRRPESFGQDRLLLTNSNIGANYKGLELTIETPRLKRLQLLFAGTASTGSSPAANRGFQFFENDHGTVGELFENPNAHTFPSGRAFFDRGYSANILGIYQLPQDSFIAAVARYQDGQSFARYLIAPELNQGPELIRAADNGLQRFTLAFTLDVRLEKSLRFGNRRFVTQLDVFNLWDTTHEVEEDVSTGATFRVPTVVQPPRAIRLTGRFEF